MDLIYAIAFIATIIIPSVPLAIFTAERGMDIITAMAYVADISVAMFLGGIIAERYYLKRLNKVKAVSPESAVTREEAEIDPGPIATGALKRLVRRKKVKATEDGRYYVECKDKKHC
jgi:hypothetical protein